MARERAVVFTLSRRARTRPPPHLRHGVDQRIGSGGHGRASALVESGVATRLQGARNFPGICLGDAQRARKVGAGYGLIVSNEHFQRPWCSARVTTIDSFGRTVRLIDDLEPCAV